MDATPFALSATQPALLAPMISTCEILKLGGRNEVCIHSVKNMVAGLPKLRTIILFDERISMEHVEDL